MRKIRNPDSQKASDGHALHDALTESPGGAGAGPIKRFYFVAVAVFLADRLSKFLALEYLESPVVLIPGVFHLTLVHNPGIAFGLFSQFPWLLISVVTVSLIVIAWMAHLPSFRKPLEQWVFGLILGGAAGNWLDRVLYGAVIDYFDFRVWPVFNIADSAISIGVGIYLIYLFRQPKAGQIA